MNTDCATEREALVFKFKTCFDLLDHCLCDVGVCLAFLDNHLLIVKKKSSVHFRDHHHHHHRYHYDGRHQSCLNGINKIVLCEGKGIKTRASSTENILKESL